MKLKLTKVTKYDGSTMYRIYQDGGYLNSYSSEEDAKQALHNIANVKPGEETIEEWEVVNNEVVSYG